MAGRLLRYAGKHAVVLRQNRKHGFAAEHALVAYPSGAVYSFIPKNACSTMRVSLAIANGCIAGPEDWPWIHPNNPTFRAELRELVTAPFTFVILRCPHARLASAFLDKIAGLRQEFWTLHRADRDRPDPDRLSFRDFVGLIEQPALFKLDIHWRPQVEFLVYDAYDLWVPLERFGAAIPEIEARAGLTIHDARPLTGHGTDDLVPVAATDPAGLADLPLTEIAALRREGKVPAHAALYDADLAARVAALYAADGRLYLKRFGPDDMLFPETFTTTGLQP